MTSILALTNQAWREIRGIDYQSFSDEDMVCFERLQQLIIKNKEAEDVERSSAICVEVAVKAANSQSSSYINACLDCANALRANFSALCTPQVCNLSMIAAMGKKGVIGFKNKLPFYLPEDLKRFKTLTMGHHIIMGRKTYESIGVLLSGRTTVIVTNNKDYKVKGALVAHSIESALLLCSNDTEAFIIGGEALFSAGLVLASKLYLTEIDIEIEGDAFFPIAEMQLWHQQSLEAHTSSKGLGYAYATYIRNDH